MPNLYRSAVALAAALVAALGTTAAHARDGDHANNGGGSAEQNIVYAYELLGTFVRNCLANDVCGLTPADRTALTDIAGGLPREGDADDLLVFRTGREEDFLLDGAVRVAKTGSAVGSKIYVNRDMIYELAGGKPAPIGVPQAAALLVHELGHHHGIGDHTYLDLLGAKLRIFLQRSIVSQNFDPRLFLSDGAFREIPFIPSFTVVSLKPDERMRPDTRFLLSDSTKAIDLSARMLPELEHYSLQNEANDKPPLCQYKNEAGEIKKGRIAGFDLLSPRWEQSYYLRPFAQSELQFILRMSVVLDVICKADGRQDWIPQGMTMEMQFQFNRNGAALEYQPTSYINPRITQRDPFR